MTDMQYSSLKRLEDKEGLVRGSEKKQPIRWKKTKNILGTGSQVVEMY